MSKKEVICLDALCPYVRKAGIQPALSWNKSRKIYDHQFMYCNKGSGAIEIEQDTYTIDSGTLILIKPNRTHRLLINENETTDINWIHFDFIYREDVYDLEQLVTLKHSVLYNQVLPYQKLLRSEIKLDNNFEFPCYMKPIRQNEMKRLFSNIINIYNQRDIGWQLEAKIYLLQILNYIYHQERADKGLRIYNKAGITEQCLNYIHQNYHRKITLKEFSKMIGYSTDHIGKVFKTQTGKNINVYINEYRLMNAKKLLLNNELTLADISDMVGFSDPYYFSKVMKSYEGLSPSQWRKSFHTDLCSS